MNNFFNMDKNLSFQEIINRLQLEALEQITLRDVIEKSRKEYYDSLKVNEDDIYSISLVDKNGTVKGIRKFRKCNRCKYKLLCKSRWNSI